MLLWATQVPGLACQCQRQHQWHKGRQRQCCRQQQQHQQLQGRRGLGEGRLARLQQAVLGRPRVRGGLRQLAPLPLLLLVPRTLPLQRARMAWERERAARGVSGDEPGGVAAHWRWPPRSSACHQPLEGSVHGSMGVCMGANRLGVCTQFVGERGETSRLAPQPHTWPSKPPCHHAQRQHAHKPTHSYARTPAWCPSPPHAQPPDPPHPTQPPLPPRRRPSTARLPGATGSCGRRSSGGCTSWATCALS